ncbi:MAG TPA: hypothetical protein VKE51_17015 [Vicinamibacterales bacterium]|nr:hypothetical protein [Vicinamibacterales bacterium]
MSTSASAPPDLRASRTDAATGALSFVALFAIVCLLAGTAPDADLWGHLTFGRDIVRTGWVHTGDPYSFASDRLWINHEWLAEVVMWSAYSRGGVAGLVALKLLLACVAGIAFLETWRRHALPPVWRDGMLFVTAFGTWPLVSTMRPQAFSIACFAVLLLTLDRIRIGRTRWLFGLPIVFAVWVNVHGGWIVGAGVLAVFVACSWCDPAWTPRDRRLLLAAACASAAATLCNPYGLSMLGFLAETVRPARADITEWQPVTRVPVIGLVLWLAPTAVALHAVWRRGRAVALWPLLTVALLAVGSFRVIRLVGFYALAVGFLIAPLTAPDAADDVVRRVRPVSGWTWLRTAATCVALVAIAVGTFGRTLAMDADWLPEREAAVFVKTHDLSGRLLTWFNYGEYAIWHFSPALRVSMDGRRETVYSEEVRDRHWRIYNNQPEAVEEVARLDPDYVWLPASFPVVSRLEAAGWRPIFEGPRSVVLSRRTPRAISSAVSLATLDRVFPGP